LEVARELLNHWARLDIANNEGVTAASEGHIEFVRIFLNHGAADLNSHVEIIQELLNHGAKGDIANKDGLTPLYSAVSRGHVEVCESC